MATKVKFETVAKPERAAKSATAKAAKQVDPVVAALPPLDLDENGQVSMQSAYLPGDVIRDPETGRRFSLRPAKKCTRCGGSGTHPAHWGEMTPLASDRDGDES